MRHLSSMEIIPSQSRSDRNVIAIAIVSINESGSSSYHQGLEGLLLQCVLGEGKGKNVNK